MKVKDMIAIWLLVVFVLWALLTAFVRFADAVNQYQSWGSILLQFGAVLVIAVAGLFPIMHFTRVMDNLKKFEDKTDQEQKDS